MAENYGIKVADNVDTATVLQAKLTTQHSSLKLYKWIDAEFTTNGSSEGSVEVPHDLGYTPIVQVWGKFTGQFTFLSATTYPDSFCLLDSYNPYCSYSTGIYFFVDNEKVRITTAAVEGFGGASPSTTYQFRVLIWVDLSEDFNDPSNIALTGDFGFKISNPGISVLTGREYQMEYSSKYKAIQYFDNHILSSSLTLPAMWASTYDDFEEEAVYVDFNHNLGYPPLFFVYSDLGGSSIYEIPRLELFGGGIYTMSGIESISAWCDSSRVRVTFDRQSIAQAGESTGEMFSAKTINIYVIIFTENLMGEANG